MTTWKVTLFLSLLTLFASCATTGGRAYREPIPYQEQISTEEFELVKDTATYRNYKKLAEWAATMWEANKP